MEHIKSDLIKDPRRLGIILVNELIKKTIKDTIEEMISVFDINPMDSADIKRRLLVKNTVKLIIPFDKESEEVACDWLFDTSMRQESLKRRRMRK